MAGAVTALGALLATSLMLLNYGRMPDWMEDLAVYVAGGRAVLSGHALYSIVVPPFGYVFTYPPFAALVFIPLTLVGGVTLNVLWTFVTVLLLQAVVFVSLRWSGLQDRALIVLITAVSAPILMWYGPVYATLATGQINLLLLLLVLLDLHYLTGRAPAGALIGVAVGLKLTPAIFIVYFLLTRRFRAAITAVAAFLATVLLSLVVVTHDTITYWSGLFLDADRIAIPQMRFNQSLHGVIVRLLHTPNVTAVWLVVALVVAAAGMALAVWAHRRGEERLALLVTAGVGLLVSPVSWEHHWVWLVPLTIYLAVRARTPLWWALLVVLVAALAWRPYSSLVPANPDQALRISDPLTLLFASWLPVVAIVAGALLAVWLATRGRTTATSV